MQAITNLTKHFTMSSIPKTCKAIVIEKEQAPFAVKDVPVEEPKEGQVLIKTEACGVCHSVRKP